MKRIISVLVLAFILSGCGVGERYELSGNSENWEVFYVVELSTQNKLMGSGTLEYTGEEPIPETFNYEIEFKLRTLKTTGEQLTARKINFGSTRCDLCYFDEDDEIELEIEWDGQTENMTLTTNN